MTKEIARHLELLSKEKVLLHSPITTAVHIARCIVTETDFPIPCHGCAHCPLSMATCSHGLTENVLILYSLNRPI